ncbi:MAG: tRNA (N6-threonylcarbamoyladenosine(37)-N6)-methyltransferase TrmO [Acutalibacteraceae bacterium]
MYNLKVIAKIHNRFGNKFGIPRQSGISDNLSVIVFEPEFRSNEAIRGLEGFSHIWLLWLFSENADKGWSPTVRPPRLGGNKRMGVFATRSPYRPNPTAISSVRLEKTEIDSKLGPVIYVRGADCLDGTPIFDIKPYISYTDSHPDAVCGFADEVANNGLAVEYTDGCDSRFEHEFIKELTEILKQDPRPSYQKDPERIYGFTYSGHEIRFRVENGVLYVCDIQ